MWKMFFIHIFVYLLYLSCSFALDNNAIPDECGDDACSFNELQEIREFFTLENELFRQRRHEQFLAEYNYNTNVSEENRQLLNDIAAKNAVLNKQLSVQIRARNLARIDDESIRRQAQILGDMGFAVLPSEDYKRLQNAISSMQSNYATATVCAYQNASKCDLMLEPHVQERMANSRDPQELAHYWQQWHDKAGTPMRQHFTQYVELSGRAAKLNYFASYADYWIHFYDDVDFESNLDDAYAAILPLYKQIHAFVRHRLHEKYGESVVPAKGHIPMHLLGNMWAQNWDEVIELYTPYPQRGFVDVTGELQRQNYTVESFFELGDEFFKSLNMLPLPLSFWNLSVLVRPTDRQVICHASAWDLYADSDVRIKMCTEINSHYLYVVHHELGHIQYYLQYEKQPTAFRGAPNPGFHEAVGDVIALSVMTMKHFKRLGLAQEESLDHEGRINELFKTALKKVAFLPFAYTMDKYRYAVFRGEIPEDQWNSQFWHMRANWSGVIPPVTRTDADFDPPAKYHIDADVEYNRYFAAHIFQFQFHKAMCLKAKQYVPGHEQLTLDNCDIFNSKEAGNAFGKFLSLGASKNWREALEEFTGETKMDTSALLEFFEPLSKWLEEENKRLNVEIGW